MPAYWPWVGENVLKTANDLKEDKLVENLISELDRVSGVLDDVLHEVSGSSKVPPAPPSASTDDPPDTDPVPPDSAIELSEADIVFDDDAAEPNDETASPMVKNQPQAPQQSASTAPPTASPDAQEMAVEHTKQPTSEPPRLSSSPMAWKHKSFKKLAPPGINHPRAASSPTSMPTTSPPPVRKAPSGPQKAVRDVDSVLFSLAALQRAQGDFSTKTYRNEKDVSDALLDIQKISGTSASPPSATDRQPGDKLERFGQTPPVMTSIGPLVEKKPGSSKPRLLLAVGLVLIGAVLGAAFFSLLIAPASQIEKQKDIRIHALQQKVDELLTLLAAADNDSIDTLKRQLKETQEELAYLKAEREELSQDDDTPFEKKMDRKLGNEPTETLASADITVSTKDKSPPQAKVTAVNASSAAQIDTLLGRRGAAAKPETEPATTPTKTPAVATPAGIPLPKKLLLKDIRQAVLPVDEKIKECGKDLGGGIDIAVAVEKTGIVSMSKAVGQYADTEVGECVSRVVEGVRFPETRKRSSFVYRFKF